MGTAPDPETVLVINGDLRTVMMALVRRNEELETALKAVRDCIDGGAPGRAYLHAVEAIGAAKTETE